ncbi:TetR/AcrR family transcriptional regulator [Oceanobacillus luteolus]|uniref:TetR/AcrR family transcriptional regulator n=1 Tax=Oceanobacillus luteolus TaxID=1274358 RepID=A0ABW4HN48_9BACI|nr:TetR/AcrR family transcriptional regulator [Oceanobacillus luteolus]
MPKISDEAKEQRRDKILQAALECFSTKGYYASTVDDIVKSCGLSKGAVYNYFKGKEEIFLSLLEQRSETILHDLKERLAEISSPLEKLKYWIRTDIPYNLEKKKFMHVHIESWLYATDAPHVQKELKARFDTLYQLTEEIIKEGQRIGEINPEIDSDSATAMFWSLHDGIWLHASIGYDEEKLEKRIIEMEKTMLAYLTTS